MTEQPRVVFNSGFDGLFSKSLRARVGPALEAELKKAGVDLQKPFLAAYPIEVWATAVELCAKHLYGDLSRPAAYRKLGHETIDGFGVTLIGKAVFAMMKIIGPARALDRATRNYASSNNYTKTTLTRMGPTSFHFHLNEKHTLPEFDMGVIEALLEVVGVKVYSVTLVSQDAEGFTMSVTWPG